MTEQFIDAAKVQAEPYPEHSYCMRLSSGMDVEATYRGWPGQDSEVAILAHSSMGSGTLQYNSARALSTAGIASVRLKMYGKTPGYNQRDRLTFTQHDYADDLTGVINYVRDNSGSSLERLYLVGHSAGGLAALMAKPNVPPDAIVALDPSHGLFWQQLKDTPHKEGVIEAQLEQDGPIYVIGTKGDPYIRSRQQIEIEQTMGDTSLCAAHRNNLLVIGASKSSLAAYGVSYVNAAVASGSNAQYVAIPDADHGFMHGETLQQALDRTIIWLRNPGGSTA